MKTAKAANKLDPEIEEKVKKALQNPEFMKNLTPDEVNMINKLIVKFPKLKNYIPENPNIINKNEVVLDEIKIGDTVYYLDKKRIWSTKAEFVGLTRDGKHYFFDKNYNLDKDINFFMTQ